MDKITSFQNNAFSIIIIMTYLIYIIGIIGISNNAPIYLEDFDYYVKIYISLFLLWRFNMFRTIKLTELDRKIAFSAGLFLFTSTSVYNMLTSYVKTNVKKSANILVNKSINYSFGILLLCYVFYLFYKYFIEGKKQ